MTGLRNQPASPNPSGAGETWLSLMGLGCLLGQQGYSTPPAARSAQGSNPRGCAALRQLLIMQLRARAYADGHGPFIETDAAVLPGDAYYIQFGRAIVYHIPNGYEAPH